MKFGWIGFHREGLPALQGVLERGYRVEAVLTLRPDLAAKRSGAATDYWTLCREFGVPLHEVANINDQASLELLRGRDLDVVFVIGWTQIVRSPALRLARIGMIGAHASLLPHNRGRAPINWTLIRGEQQTGNSLIWLAEGVDRGSIIDQTLIPITPYDTCDSLYHQVAASNRDMILRVLPQLMVGKRPGRPQPHTDEAELPGRWPEDGLLDWSKPHLDVYDFVRALTRPYAGAFSRLDGKRWTLWRCVRLPEVYSSEAQPGQVLGPAFSFEEAACGQVVACSKGAIILLEEDEEGKILKGPRLSDQVRQGKVWGNE